MAIMFSSVTILALIQFYISRPCFSGEDPLDRVYSTVDPVKNIYENACDFQLMPNTLLETEEAIAVAECFILENGYTDRPPLGDKSKITPENVYPQTDEAGMKRRHDSLERRAYSYYQSEGSNKNWQILFRYKPKPEIVEYYGERLKTLARAVVMDQYGKDLRIMHSDQPLNLPQATRIIR